MTSAQTKDPNKVDPSVAELIRTASQDFSRLLQAHIELAKAEMKESATRAAAAAAVFVVAAVLAFLGFIFLLVTLAYVLAIWLPVWAGFGIVMLLLFLVAVILVLAGRAQSKKIKGPERTIEQIDETKQALQTLTINGPSTSTAASLTSGPSVPAPRPTPGAQPAAPSGK